MLLNNFCHIIIKPLIHLLFHIRFHAHAESCQFGAVFLVKHDFLFV